MKTTSVSVNIGGTPVYMAPEAFDRKRTVQTDIWSVGVILYQMLKGELPFPYSNFTDLLGALFKEDPQPFSESIPKEL
jgi:serine/threonine-protein kinase